MDQKTALHIVLLLELERTSNVRFNRVNEGTISVSCLGYCHMDLNSAEEQLLKLGCRYDFDRGVAQFDSMSGRTYTFFKEPKNG